MHFPRKRKKSRCCCCSSCCWERERKWIRCDTNAKNVSVSLAVAATICESRRCRQGHVTDSPHAEVPGTGRRPRIPLSSPRPDTGWFRPTATATMMPRARRRPVPRSLLPFAEKAATTKRKVSGATIARCKLATSSQGSLRCGLLEASPSNMQQESVRPPTFGGTSSAYLSPLFPRIHSLSAAWIRRGKKGQSRNWMWYVPSLLLTNATAKSSLPRPSPSYQYIPLPHRRSPA